MASASRALGALRPSFLRATASRQTPRLLARPTPAARRGYASAHESTAQSSDLPWLIGSTAVTVPAAAYLIYSGPLLKKKPASSAHHGGSETPSGAPISPDDEAPAVEESSSDNNSSSSSSSSSEDEGGKQQFSPSNSEDEKKQEGNPQAGQTDATGREVPPPSADNASIAEKWDEKKEAHEEYKEKSRAGETKVFSSSSDAPSKKTLTEDPREDPKGGEGEGAKKGGPAGE